MRSIVDIRFGNDEEAPPVLVTEDIHCCLHDYGFENVSDAGRFIKARHGEGHIVLVPVLEFLAEYLPREAT